MRGLNLKDLSLQEMEALISSLGEKPYRARQIYEWVFQKDVGDIGGMTNLSLKLRNQLSELSYISRLSIADKRVSKDGTEKYLFILPPLHPPLPTSPSPPSKGGEKGEVKGGSGVSEDGNSIESVLIPDEEKLTLCISTQVGCKLRCAFCLTGRGGFVRNLKHSEIIEQVLAVQREIQKRLIRQDIQDGQEDEGVYRNNPLNPPFLRGNKKSCNPVNPVKEKITNIVFMGMGEPLDNYEAVVKAIKTMISPYGLKIPARRITLSTAGLIPEIKELAKENLKINLAVSLNAANDETRDKIMPVNKKYPIEDLLKVLREYPLPTGRRITFEYVMIKDINDSMEDAERLSRLLKGMRCKINLIPLNPPFTKGGKGGIFEGSDYESPPYKRVEDFQNLLISRHYTAIIRKSKGADILAACGQLRGRILNADLRDLSGLI
jgi:23S rRNA (adenine2503-C2)-methyltransferase